ncbi:hypothetical protein [Metabacillus niabensis]|uniref:Holin n=1 Tax=Metabacillus niabensis TaxID=324854 RepID=A0ABT9Z0U4_9BACI|nr:hypothetical protein [Metabacillus niabensis]MDQ0225878.1 hypothetical protein [Metabacillus niabensis]
MIWNQNKILFYTIKGSSIKQFFIIDLVVGTGIYYGVETFSSNVVIAIIGCVIGTEGIKRIPKLIKSIE